MEFSSKLIKGTLIRRHSRFLADVELESGKFITAHTSNTGAMLGCKEPGSTVWLSNSKNPKRKYLYTWEIIETRSGEDVIPVGINTMLSNHLVKEAIENGTIVELQGYQNIRSEVKYGAENSRIDLLLENTNENSQVVSPCYVEVKNVTLVNNNIAYFPDAVSKRGTKHLRELADVVRQGGRAVIFYCAQRSDAQHFRPADDIDPEYGRQLRQSIDLGVEAIAYQAKVSEKSIQLEKKLPVFVPN